MTQEQLVLDHLKRRGSITSFEAMMDHHIVHLPKRINNLRKDGYEIESVWKTNEVTGKRYVRYFLREKEAAA